MVTTSSRLGLILPALPAFLVIAACGRSPDGSVTDAPGGSGDASSDAPADAMTDAMVDAGPLGDPFAAFASLPTVCSGDGWCWSSPKPSGTSYTHVVSSAPDNIWITGGGPPSYAAILQWNGHAWIEHKPPLGTCSPGVICEYAFPMSIATSGPNNTWLIYTNLTEHWDGTTWTIVDVELTNASVNGVWIDPGGDAWVTRSNGVLKRWHNGVATVFNLGFGTGSIWGTAADDFFMTVIGGLIHYNGTSFSLVYQGKTAGGYQGEKNNVWISGGDGVILHWNGTFVTEQPGAVIPAHANVRTLDYASRDDVSWIASGTSAGAEYFIHWNGTQLETTPIDPAFTPLGDNVCGSFSSAKVIDGRTWILCGGGGIVTRTGPSTIQPVIAPFIANGNVWGTSVNDLYHTQDSSLRHWDGTTWTTTPIRISWLTGLAGTGVGGANELFGADFTITSGNYTWYLDHFDGAAWSPKRMLTQHLGSAKFIATVYALGHDEAMIVGGLGTAIYYKDGVLAPIASGTTSDLISVWGPDADHLWITGYNGTLFRWDRSNPDVLGVDSSFPATSDHLRTITAAGGVTWISVENDLHVWMKPAAGAWQQVSTHIAPNSMVALSATNVLLSATDSGILARWNGTSFVTELYPSWRGLQALFALPDGTTYLSGNAGVIVHAP